MSIVVREWYVMVKELQIRHLDNGKEQTVVMRKVTRLSKSF